MAINFARMRPKTAVMLTGLIAFSASTALAGGPAPCGVYGQPACDRGVEVLRSPTGHSSGATVQNHEPYDFLDTVHFQRSPHVSITRVHGLDIKPDVQDAPISFTKGCHPTSTAYCRTGVAQTPDVTTAPEPITPPPPVVTAPPRIIHPPVVNRPVVSPCAVHQAPRPCGTATRGQIHQGQAINGRIVATAGHVDPSKFVPRIYGDPYSITPGIAYLPTSKVIRDPYQAQAVLDAGPGGVTPALSGLHIRPHLPVPYYPYQPRAIAPVQPVQIANTHTGSRYGMTLRYAGPQHHMSGGRYSSIGHDGTYWERVSGPTRIGGQIATEVVCKRQHPGYQPHPPSPCSAKAGPAGRRY
jgi:hypothetical protein